MIIPIDNIRTAKALKEKDLRKARLKYRHIAMFELDNPAYSDREKITGIVDIANMATHNSVPKDSMIAIIRYMLDFIVADDWRDRK